MLHEVNKNRSFDLPPETSVDKIPKKDVTML
jgi:hypothetical protein